MTEVARYQRPRIDFTLVFAHSIDGLIGRKGTLPWKCPEDLEHFKQVTNKPDSVVLMGYKTWESLPVGKTSGEKLVGRRKLVLTRKKDLKPLPNTVFVNTAYNRDIEHMLMNMGVKTVFIIGGAEVIQSYMYQCNSSIITVIEQRFEREIADTRVDPAAINRWLGSVVESKVLSGMARVEYRRKEPEVEVAQAEGEVNW
jgi:dihydrofolate reductase